MNDKSLFVCTYCNPPKCFLTFEAWHAHMAEDLELALDHFGENIMLPLNDPRMAHYNPNRDPVDCVSYTETVRAARNKLQMKRAAKRDKKQSPSG